ncbi:MAG: gliding motility-associated C-terminal domain-containing protein [Bacteroidia bacterium]
MKIIFLALFILNFTSLFSQSKSPRFEKHIMMDNELWLYQYITTKDSGYCLLSNVQSGPKSTPINITRLDKFGNLLWSKNFFTLTPNYYFNSANTIVNTFDNGFVFGGNFSFDLIAQNNIDSSFICKIDANGNLLWTKKHQYLNAGFGNIIELSDSNLVIPYAYWQGTNLISIVQKMDRNGNQLWAKHVWGMYDLKETQRGNIQILSNSGYILSQTGIAYIKEIDKNGNDVREKTYHISKGNINPWKMDINDKKETIIISDYFDSSGVNVGIHLLKIDSGGKILISYIYSGGWNMCQSYFGQYTNDNGIMINSRLVYQTSAGYFTKHGILNLTLDGDVKWLKTYGHDYISTESELSINTKDCGYSLIDYIWDVDSSFLRMIKTDVDGKTPCNNDSLVQVNKRIIPFIIDTTKHVYSFENVAMLPFNLIVTSISPIVNTVCSDFIDGGGCHGDTTKIDSICMQKIPNIFSPNNDGINDKFFISNCTKPFVLTIYNRWGELICKLSPANNDWDGKHLGIECSEGIYFYVLESVNETKTTKTKGFIELIR